MIRRPTPKSLETLRTTLQKLEQTEDHGEGDASISELKRVVLNRIADLELSKKLSAGDEESDDEAEPPDLSSLPLIAEESTPEMDIDKTPLEKLD